MREQHGVTINCARPTIPVNSRTNLFGRLAAWASTQKVNRPGALLGRQLFVFDIVPLREVEIDDGLIAQACQIAGLSCPLHRATEKSCPWRASPRARETEIKVKRGR